MTTEQLQLHPATDRVHTFTVTEFVSITEEVIRKIVNFHPIDLNTLSKLVTELNRLKNNAERKNVVQDTIHCLMNIERLENYIVSTTGLDVLIIKDENHEVLFCKFYYVK
jgi:hypothetical protein